MFRKGRALLSALVVPALRKARRAGHPPAIYWGLPISCLQLGSEEAVEVAQSHHCRQKTFVTLPEIPFIEPLLTVISLPVPLIVHSSTSPVPFHANLTEP